MNLSFAGCGFLGIYHVGVAVCFKKYAPHLLLEKCGGASAGALSACCLLCDLPLGSMTSDFFRVVNEARRHSLGPFSPSFNIQTCLYEGLQKHLPDDAHKRVNGRLHISLTRVYDGKNIIVSEFSSREELLQALLCACFIPGFSGILPPRFRGVRYMDGAFSDNLPILDENTITVSPFCGESDICPRDQSSQLFHLNWANTSIEISRQNVNRFVRILFPPRAELLSKFCQQGFDDALQFLHRNNLISCRRCVAVQSTIIVSEMVSQHQDFDPDCRECKIYRKDALTSNMPQTVLDVIQDYLEQANKGLANWLFKHRGVKLLSLPATVPVDFFLATISKISTLTPKVTKQIRRLLDDLINELNQAVQVRVLNKLFISGQPQFDISGLFHSTRFYAPRVSILLDECGPPTVEADVDNYEHVLKVTTHNDAIYAYYYTDDQTNKVKVTEIFDVTENDNLPSDLKVYEDAFDNHANSHHLHNAVESEWNCAESDFFIDKRTTTQANTVNDANQLTLQSRTYAPYAHYYHMEIIDEQQRHQIDAEKANETNNGKVQNLQSADNKQQSSVSDMEKTVFWNSYDPQDPEEDVFNPSVVNQDQLQQTKLQHANTLSYHVHSCHTVHMSTKIIPEQSINMNKTTSVSPTTSAPTTPVSELCINIE